MQKINFTNLPSQTTPVNATNLNQLQTNVENGILDSAIAEYGDGSIDPNTTLYPLILTRHSNAPEGQGTLFYIETKFFNSRNTTSNRTQIAYGYAVNSQYQRDYFNGTWGDWVRVMTNTNIAIANNVDFNTITTQGTYFEGGVPTGSNKPPIDAAGVLEVFVYSAFIIQRYTPYTAAKICVRGKYSTNAWSAWKSTTLS